MDSGPDPRDTRTAYAVVAVPGMTDPSDVYR